MNPTQTVDSQQAMAATANSRDSGQWIAPALVALAFASFLGSVTVFLSNDLAGLPKYFANRYLVLDPTSMLLRDEKALARCRMFSSDLAALVKQGSKLFIRKL